MTSRRYKRVAIGGVQLRQPLTYSSHAAWHTPRRLAPFVRHGDRLVGHLDRFAEMGDRLLEGRAVQGLVARLAPPFDGEIVEPSLCEMMRDRFWLGRRAFRVVAQKLSGPPVQRLPTALEKAVIGGVLDQRVLEPVIRLRRRTLNKQQVGVGKPIQR